MDESREGATGVAQLQDDFAVGAYAIRPLTYALKPNSRGRKPCAPTGIPRQNRLNK
jgi:hypothetical protein